MKVFFCSIFSILYLIQVTIAQTEDVSLQTVEDDLSISGSPTESATTTNIDQDRISTSAATPLIEGTLDLPIMRDQLTITESSQEGPLGVEDIHSSYTKMIQGFAATLEDDGTGANVEKRASKRHKLLDILVGFVIEVVVTLIVLKIAFLIGEFRYRFAQIAPICLVIAFVGALLNFILNLGLFHPIQIGLSFVIMLFMVRIMTDAHEWAAALQVTFVARLVTTGIIWLAFAGMMVLFGL